MARPLLVLVAAALLAASPAFPQEAPLAWQVAAGLARLGPRPDGSPAQEKAVRFLVGEMQRAGLRDVRTVPVADHAEWVNLTGVVPGRSDREIVLSAHWDTVPRSPGADDDASGCGVAIAAAADLARTPLEHTVRVVLFDAEETGLHGSRGWVDGLPPAQRERILADLNVEMVGWTGSAGPTIHTFPVLVRGERTLAPGWLVHFLLRSGEAVGWPYAVSDAQAPVLAQLVLRTARVRLGADANAFAAHGIPALSVSDTSLLTMDPTYHEPTDTPERLDRARLERWTTAMAAAVRRLDELSGRPVDEDEYLAIFGRVWLRRDLYWVGLALWVLLAFRGRPTTWRFASAEERSREGRRYIPGLVFRLLFALSVVLAPVFAVLLFPAALLAAFPPKRMWARVLAILAGLLPFLIYLGALGAASALHLASFRSGIQVWPTVLVPGTAVAFVFLIAERQRI
jgi:aminopeptidase S